ncbi:hypothetical protein QBC44DRAFT_392478 [Cladorrhinum sp. PSN332]|nr:hypothetical protein QBC44DRAFT_392478 [Cladorrhinum sp. PSN332]
MSSFMSRARHPGIGARPETQSSLLRRVRDSEIDFDDDFRIMTMRRKNMTRVHGASPNPEAQSDRTIDFLDVVSLICDIYQGYMGDLIPMQQFHSTWENEEDAGHTCVVTSRSISSPTPSSTVRGETNMSEEKVIVKRTKKGIFETRDSALRSLVNELRIRSHLPLRRHPNIVDLKGVAWDFENDDETKPRPMLVEEFAPHRSLETFWNTENLVRMPFKVKARLCRDVAQGISALHACGIVHGDIKPGNILIFPARAQRVIFTAKLTDFGHSVCEFERRPSLPAWTPLWSAPEADPDISGNVQMTFQEMMATDVYSFGLVAISITIGTSIFSAKFLDFKDAASVKALKIRDEMVERTMNVVIQEDRTQMDSDFDFAVIQSLLESSLRKSSLDRSLAKCLTALQSYKESLHSAQDQTPFDYRPIEGLSARPPTIGYRSLNNCSYLVKSKIVSELKRTASDGSDGRQAACAWELCVCYFCGFGVQKDLMQCQYWLTRAALGGLSTAQAFYLRLHDAMGVDSHETFRLFPEDLVETQNTRLDRAAAVDSLIDDWLVSAAALGCVDVLPSLKKHDDNPECPGSHYQKAIAGFREAMAAEMKVTQAALGSPPMSLQLLEAAALGNLERLRTILEMEPQLVTQVDAAGNGLLILAAKSGSYDVLHFLLQRSDVDASPCNAAQQSVLHFLSIFDDDEARVLAQKIVDKGANVSQEGDPVAYSSKISTFSLSVRCCPLANAIIHKRMALLEALLTASHSTGSLFPCRVCEAGSRYRKIIAIAVALHCNDAINILLRHLGDRATSLDCIEVWYNEELVPIRRVPFEGFALRGLDLPEPFLRAMYHGRDHMDALHKTLDCLVNGHHKDTKVVYEMIRDSIRHDAADALDHLLDNGFRDTNILQFALDIKDFYNNPIFMSIRLGFRHVFERLVNKDGDMVVRLQTRLPCSTKCGHRRPGLHEINMAHLCLSAAVTAANYDLFFVEFILQHCRQDVVLARPCQLDEELSGQPSAFMAQAIFCAFRSVSIIATKYPAVLGQLVHQLPFADRLRASQSYTATSNCPLLKWDAIMPVEPMPLPQFILLAGSNGDCQFLQELRIQDAKQAHQQRTRSPDQLPSQQCHGAALDEDDLDSADEDWTWRDHPISLTEFHWLLVGLIAEDRPAREPLWELVKHQLELQRRGTRLSADAYYVRLAVMYANHRALAQLLNNGWNMNGGMAGLFCSPLQLALCIEKAGLMLPIEPHKCYNLGCLRLPQNNFATLTDRNKNSLGQSISLLRARGGTGRPRILSFLLDSPLAGMTLTGLILVIHLVVLPLGIGFAFQPEAPEARRLKFLYLYTWSLNPKHMGGRVFG